MSERVDKLQRYIQELEDENKRLTAIWSKIEAAVEDSERLDKLDSLSEEQKEDFIFELHHAVGPIRDLIDKLEEQDHDSL